MGIGGKVIVVADAGVAVEGEEEDEGGYGKSGGKGGGDAAEEGAEGEEGDDPEGEVEGEEGVDGRVAEEGEEEGVDIYGDGAEVVGEVAVEDIALGDAPREVEFAGEVDVCVGPGEPGGVESEGRQDGV